MGRPNKTKRPTGRNPADPLERVLRAGIRRARQTGDARVRRWFEALLNHGERAPVGHVAAGRNGGHP